MRREPNDTSQRNQRSQPRAGAELPRGIGLHGRVPVTWGAAGGILLGGVLIALMTLSGRLSGHGLFFTSTGLFLIGGCLGMLHGAALGYFGRPEDTPPRKARADLARSILYAVPALAVSWLVTLWIAMTMPATYLDRVLPLAGVALAWGAGFVLIAIAAVTGWRALANAYARWPERRPGTALVAASFVALLVIFLADRPELWGLQVRVTEMGAVLLAGFLTFWVAGPAVTLALRLLKQLPVPNPGATFAPGEKAWADLGLGVAVGAAVGLLAVPFLNVTAPALGGGGAVVAALGQAVVDEVALRLVLLTGVAWLLLRWHRVHETEAVVGAVAVTAVVQLVLYAPDVVAIGFSSLTVAVGFALATVALPAVAFGVLYWKRGFATALLADATAVAALALLALAL